MKNFFFQHHKSFPYVSLPYLFIVTVIAVSLQGTAFAKSLNLENKIKGITVAPIEDRRLGEVGYGTEPCNQALEEIEEVGADWISLTPYGRMDNLQSTDILFDFEIPFEENVERIKRTAQHAKALGLEVALIPHLHVMTGEWRGEIEMKSDAEFLEWFKAYDSYVLRWAQEAEKMGASLFSIGVEFKSTSNLYQDRWKQTIELVRTAYSGPITYSANWDEVETVGFWDELDAVGINAFWPLAEKPDDGYSVIAKKSQQIAKKLEQYYVNWGKPILFTEFGVKSATDAALAPWEWPEHCNDLVYDEYYQASAYSAVFEVITKNPWFLGMFIWKYFSDPYDETQEDRAGFTPKYKLAEKVLSFWYNTDWSVIPQPAQYMQAIEVNLL